MCFVGEKCNMEKPNLQLASLFGWAGPSSIPWVMTHDTGKKDTFMLYNTLGKLRIYDLSPHFYTLLLQ